MQPDCESLAEYAKAYPKLQETHLVRLQTLSAAHFIYFVDHPSKCQRFLKNLLDFPSPKGVDFMQQP